MTVIETAATDRATAQRRQALAVANERRIRKAEVKRTLGDMRSSAAIRQAARIVERTDDPALQAFTVVELVGACPKIGRVRTAKLIRAAQISPTKRLRELCLTQRARLAAVLREAARR